MAWPVLVNKQKVEWMIKFLVANNDWYRDDDVWFSLENFGQLFHTADKDSDIGILQCMQVECDQQERQDIWEVSWDEAWLQIIMDNHAYMLGDHSLHSHESMKACVLAYALDHKHFLNSCAGSEYCTLTINLAVMCHKGVWCDEICTLLHITGPSVE